MCSFSKRYSDKFVVNFELTTLGRIFEKKITTLYQLLKMYQNCNFGRFGQKRTFINKNPVYKKKTATLYVRVCILFFCFLHIHLYMHAFRCKKKKKKNHPNQTNKYKTKINMQISYRETNILQHCLIFFFILNAF